MKFINRFFSKIFVISLYDNPKRWKKVAQQFSRRGIQADRFIAVDGRCKKQTNRDCLDKLKTFEISFNVVIDPNERMLNLKELVPAASLTISTILILRDMVQQKYPYILICEDDINLMPSFNRRFEQGIKEIGSQKWDLLYLGCGISCGTRGISKEKTRKNKHSAHYSKYGDTYYVSHYDDLRMICYDDECPEFSEHISWAKPMGTWCYAYSLSGAKKLLKYIDNNAGEHIDRIIADHYDKLKILAFDPPIAMHEDFRKGRVTDIPWTD